MVGRVREFIRKIVTEMRSRVASPPMHFERPLKVLCVLREDTGLTQVMQHMLEQMGLEMAAVFDWQEGLTLMRVEEPDVVILDEMAPGVDISKTFTAMKADSNLYSIPLVFIASRPLEHKIWGGPVREVLMWPMGPGELFRAIEWVTSPGRLSSTPVPYDAEPLEKDVGR